MQPVSRQRLNKHPAIRARNSRTNVYSLRLGSSQRAHELLGTNHVTCVFCVVRAERI
jgi:hypothetical protein